MTKFSASNNIALTCGYIFVGLGLFLFDPRASAVWFINGFLFGLALWAAICLNSLALSVLFCLFFLGHAVGGVIFFLEQDRYATSGWHAVGNFDFTLSSFYQAYLPVFVFCSILLIVTMVSNLFWKRLKKNEVFEFNKWKRNYAQKDKRFITVFFIFGLCILNYWMFENDIGVSGIVGTELPYKLNGILVVFRLLLVPILLALLLLKSRHQVFISSLIVGYSLFASFCSGGRIMLFVNTFPVFIVLFADKRKRAIFIIMLITLSFYSLTTTVKFLNFQSGKDLFSNILVAFQDFSFYDIYDNFSAVILRLYGSQQVILASQHQNNDPLSEVISFLINKKPFYDVARDLYGLNLPPNMKYGVGVGLPSQVNLATNGNPFYMLPICFVIVFLFSISNLVIAQSKEISYYYNLCARVGLLLSVVFLNDGYWEFFVGLTFLLLLGSFFAKFSSLA